MVVGKCIFDFMNLNFNFQKVKKMMCRRLHSVRRSLGNNIGEIQTTFVLTCGKVRMWEGNSRKLSRREHSFIIN